MQCPDPSSGRKDVSSVAGLPPAVGPFPGNPNRGHSMQAQKDPDVSAQLRTGLKGHSGPGLPVRCPGAAPGNRITGLPLSGPASLPSLPQAPNHRFSLREGLWANIHHRITSYGPSLNKRKVTCGSLLNALPSQRAPCLNLCNLDHLSGKAN